MAFRPEVLEPYFQHMLETNYNHYNPKPNLGIVKAFLTGETNTLAPLPQNWFNERFTRLAELLINEQTSTENKQLLIQLFKDPEINKNYRYKVAQYLAPYEYDLDNITERYLRVKEMLEQLGYSRVELGNMYANHASHFMNMEPIKCEELLRHNSNPVLNLIKEAHLSRTSQEMDELVFRKNRSNYDFSIALATLLKIYNPERHSEYLRYYEKTDTAPFIAENVMHYCLKTDPEKYLPYYQNWIRQCGEQTGEETLKKLYLTLAYSAASSLTEEYHRLALKTLDLLTTAGTELTDQTINNHTFPFSDIREYRSVQLVCLALKIVADTNAEKAIGYWNLLDEKNYCMEKTGISLLYETMGKQALPLLQKQFLKKSPSEYNEKERIETLTGILNNHIAETDYSLFWNFGAYQSKICRNAMIPYLAEHDKEAEARGIEGLKGRTAEQRLNAARVLAILNTPGALNALRNSIETEKDDEARDIMLAVAGDEYLAGITEETLPAIIAAHKKRGKLKKELAPWLEETTLPPLFFKSGKQLNQEEVRFILYRMSRVKDLATEPEIKPVIAVIDNDRSAGFAKEILRRYKEAGYDAKFKYLLGVAALFGDEEMVGQLQKGIDEWIEGNRKLMAELGIKALSLHKSNKALRVIEWYSRKYKSKKPNFGEAALQSLENAANELGITIHELGDRIVPDFGFQGLFRHFTVNGEEYRAFIDSKFKIAFFNEDNKKIKTIPAAAPDDLKEEFKYIGKEIRDIVKSQSSRLEYYLTIQRQWTPEQWRAFFLENPVMFIYATKLVWGVFDELDKLVATFICNDDTSLLDEQGEETALPENGKISIVHPGQLSPESLQNWKKLLFDYSVEQVFPQLDRPLPDMEGIDMSSRMIKKYLHTKMAVGSIRSTLERAGWFKGPTGDGGYLESIKLLYFEKKLEAVLELDGVGVGYGWSNQERTGRLYFIDKSKIKSRYDSIRSEDDEKLIPLHQLPPIFLAEVIGAIDRIKRVEKKTTI